MGLGDERHVPRHRPDDSDGLTVPQRLVLTGPVRVRGAELAREDVNPRLFWRSPVGAAIGNWALSEFNVANRLNLPAPSLLGFLWGWASSSTASAALARPTLPMRSIAAVAWSC